MNIKLVIIYFIILISLFLLLPSLVLAQENDQIYPKDDSGFKCQIYMELSLLCNPSWDKVHDQLDSEVPERYYIYYLMFGKGGYFSLMFKVNPIISLGISFEFSKFVYIEYDMLHTYLLPKINFFIIRFTLLNIPSKNSNICHEIYINQYCSLGFLSGYHNYDEFDSKFILTFSLQSSIGYSISFIIKDNRSIGLYFENGIEVFISDRSYFYIPILLIHFPIKLGMSFHF